MAKVTTLLTGLMLVSLVFLGFTTFLSSLASEYDITVEARYTDVYSSFNQTTADLEAVSTSLQEKAETQVSSNPFFNFMDQMFNIGWNAVSALTSTFATAGTMVDATSEVPGLAANPWIVNGLKVMMVLAIALALVAIMIRRPL